MPLERDAMICRSCGNEERASEGYPCEDCGTFVCQLCTMRGVTLCSMCAAKAGVSSASQAAKPVAPPAPTPSWLED